MAKVKVTQKEIKSTYNNVVAIGYCNLQYLLNYFTPQCYTVRKEGWASDIYDFGTTAISTGYAPFGNIRIDYEILRHYDKIGEKLRYDSVLTWQAKKKKAKQLIEKIIKEAIKKEDK